MYRAVVPATRHARLSASARHMARLLDRLARASDRACIGYPLLCAAALHMAVLPDYADTASLQLLDRACPPFHG